VQENRRDRILTETEIRTLWLALDAPTFAHVASLFRLQLLTAQRVGEVMSMSWNDIDLASASWTIPSARSKNKHSHRVPLSMAAQAILKTIGPASGWVFPAPHLKDRFMPAATLHKSVERLRKATGIEFRTHDLRRSATTYMAECDIQPHVLGKILNHADHTVTTRHYVWTSYDPQARIALETWSRKLKDIIEDSGNKTNVVPFAANG